MPDYLQAKCIVLHPLYQRVDDRLTKSDDKGKTEESRLSRLKSLWRGNSSENYAAVKSRLQAMRKTVQTEIAEQFAQILNAELTKRPHETLRAKQQLARWANAEMRSLDLCIRCPKTGQPAMLFGVTGHHPVNGRFQIELISRDTGPKRTVSSPALISLELMPHPPRREPLAEHWAERVTTVKTRGREREQD